MKSANIVYLQNLAYLIVHKTDLDDLKSFANSGRASIFRLLLIINVSSRFVKYHCWNWEILDFSMYSLKISINNQYLPIFHFQVQFGNLTSPFPSEIYFDILYLASAQTHISLIDNPLKQGTVIHMTSLPLIH